MGGKWKEKCRRNGGEMRQKWKNGEKWNRENERKWGQ
jgi:hypothetical protein